MSADFPISTVKKTVVILSSMDSFIRKTWAMLIEQGYNATYSTALNWMLLAAVLDTRGGDGLSEETKKLLKWWMDDQASIEQLNLKEHLVNLKEFWGTDR